MTSEIPCLAIILDGTRFARHVHEITREPLGEIMRCYFSSDKTGPPDQSGLGFVSFVIPELKITFRARYNGTAAACEYASLLALLEFVEINPKVFEGKVLEVFGDSFNVVNQIMDRLPCGEDLAYLRRLALLMRERIPYTIDWIPPAENPAGPQTF